MLVLFIHIIKLLLVTHTHVFRSVHYHFQYIFLLLGKFELLICICGQTAHI